MANTPEMNLNLPIPSTTLGPQWATELNVALEVVDVHDHTPGKGTPVPVAGIIIDNDLEMNGKNLTEVNTVVVNSSIAADVSPAKLGSFQVVNGEAFFVDLDGNAVQITSSGVVNAAASSSTPPGIMMGYGGTSAPAGYLICDGTAISRSTYSGLFAAIGTVWGVGDGTTTFNLPNPQGRTLIGAGTYTDPVSGSITRNVAQVLGAAEHLLTSNEMPNHTHIDFGHNHSIYGGGTGGVIGYGGVGANSPAGISGAGTGYYNTGNGTQLISTATAAISSTGGSVVHNNMQPSLGINYIIKT